MVILSYSRAKLLGKDGPLKCSHIQKYIRQGYGPPWAEVLQSSTTLIMSKTLKSTWIKFHDHVTDATRYLVSQLEGLTFTASLEIWPYLRGKKDIVFRSLTPPIKCIIWMTIRRKLL